MKKPLIIISGPTATGKSSLSIELAKRINGEIISADSMQVYKYMNIGTAKVSEIEQREVKHHLIDIIKPNEEFNVFIFQRLVKEAINEIINKGKVPIIVGGTGFYIQSVLYDIEFLNMDTDNDYRDYLEKLADEKGNNYIHRILENIDIESFNKIHPNNRKRVIRALEYYKLTNSPISIHNKKEKEKESPYNYLFYVLNMDRKLLYERIDKRVDNMFDNGLVEEVENLLDLGYSKDFLSMQGLGYKEIIPILEGDYDLDTGKYILKRDTRHFAKRQLTWFRSKKDVRFLEMEEYDFNFEKILLKITKDIEVNRIM